MTQKGQAILNIRMTTVESYTDKVGERKEMTEWHTVTVWGKRAESLHKLLHVGQRICVEGSIKTRSYEQEGQKRYKTEINASSILLAGHASEQQRELVPAERPRQQYPAASPGAKYEPDPFDDSF